MELLIAAVIGSATLGLAVAAFVVLLKIVTGLLKLIDDSADEATAGLVIMLVLIFLFIATILGMGILDALGMLGE